ncbi:MAG: hypothetical protein KME47_09670 [Nodosilinea sp. WJT8-NPBG4]|jgi:hypothetical protein|nr:hypothetical protein [Nodosilinea sp. WJT8-NPBG4]
MNKKAHRPQQITIDTVRPNSLPILSILVQKVELDADNKVVAIIGNTDRVYRNAMEVVQETIAFTDPITKLSGSISIAGLQSVMTKLANRWISEDIEKPIDPITGWTTE